MNIHSVKLGRARGVWCRAARMRRLGSTIQACCADRQQTTLRSPAAPGSIPPGDPHINRKLFSRAFQNRFQNQKRLRDAKNIRQSLSFVHYPNPSIIRKFHNKEMALLAPLSPVSR